MPIATIFDMADTHQRRFLSCRECGPATNSWPATGQSAQGQVCEHINDFIREEQDAKFIEENSQHYIRLCLTPESHQVYFPRLRDLDLTMFVVGPQLPGGFRSVILTHERMVDGTKLEQDLGLLGPGEGRMTVARMALDWMISQTADGETWTNELKTPCRARSHRYLQQKELQEVFDWAKQRSKHTFMTIKLLVLIALVLEGACPPCLWSATTDDNYGLDDLQTNNNPGLLSRMQNVGSGGGPEDDDRF